MAADPNASSPWIPLKSINSPVLNKNIRYLSILGFPEALQAENSEEIDSYLVQKENHGIRCRSRNEPYLWISGKTDLLQEKNQLLQAIGSLPASTKLILCIGSYAGLLLQALLEKITHNQNIRVLVIEPSFASLRAGLTFVDIRPGLETGRLHFAIGSPTQDFLLRTIEKFNLWSDEPAFFLLSPVVETQINPESFHAAYQIESKKQQETFKEDIRFLSQIHNTGTKQIARVLLIDGWPQAPQAVHIHAIKKALDERGIPVHLLEISGYLLDLYPHEYRRHYIRGLLGALNTFQPDVIISYAYHAPQILSGEISAVLNIPWVQVISNLAYYDDTFLDIEHTAVIERHLLPYFSRRGAPHPFFVPIMADYVAGQPVMTSRKFPIVFVGNSLGLSITEASQLRDGWKKRDALLLTILQAEQALGNFDLQQNLYDYLKENPLPQIESFYEEYQVFRYLLCQATAARRVRLLEKLARFGLVVFGDWSNVSLTESPLQGCIKGPIPIDKEPDLFEQGNIFVNIHSVGHVTGPNMRFFNVPGMGGFSLTDGEFQEYLHPGMEMAVFSSEKDLVDQTTYYLHHPKEADQIRYNGFGRVRKDWTYQKWIDMVFTGILLKKT